MISCLEASLNVCAKALRYCIYRALKDFTLTGFHCVGEKRFLHIRSFKLIVSLLKEMLQLTA